MIPVNLPLLDGNERKYVEECIETGWISSEGPFVSRFEEAFAGEVQRNHGVACSSGSAALDLAITAAGVGPGDEVIMPTFTIISPALSVVRAGGTPVLVDCDAITWNMDVAQVEARVSPRTRAIVIVHIYGLPVDLDPILAVASKHGLIVIEDAAEMHGQTYKDQPCGSFGDLSTFSFYPNKHVTTGEGGMVVTNDPSLADRCRSLRNLCFQAERRFVHDEMGWNYRITNLQAALGLAQLESLTQHVTRKRQIGSLYRDCLVGEPRIQLQPAATEYAENIHWVNGLVIDDQAKGDASDYRQALSEHNIGTRPFFWPMHWQPVFNKRGLFTGEQFPNAERISQRGFYLPSGLGLTDDEVRTVSQTLLLSIEQMNEA